MRSGCGTADIFLCVEPITGKTVLEATERRTAVDYLLQRTAAGWRIYARKVLTRRTPLGGMFDTR